MNTICFIANKYPNIVDPNGLVFVQQLVWSIADQGRNCIVICPLAVNLYPGLLKVPEQVTERTEKGKEVKVYFPKFFGLGQSHYILGRSPVPITTDLFTNAVRRVIHKHKLQIDIVYGHFAAPAGVCAARIGRELGIPAFMAHGESTAWSIEQFGEEKIRKELATLKGVVAVSTRNMNLLIETQAVEDEKIEVFPNGYRPERFYPRDKQKSREQLGWSQEEFIAGFVGSFDERKGVLRLQKAAEKAGVKFACAGKGTLKPEGLNCLMAAPVSNDKLPVFYSAIDVFVLPTRNEGCCNAIIEAMACGCPIISSDRDFNYDICSKDTSVLIDPDSIEEISEAILKLKRNRTLLHTLSEQSLQNAEHLTLNDRANRIIEFIERA